MRRFLPGKKAGLCLLAVVLVLAGLAYWNRASLLSRYYVSQLAQADEASREEWVNRVVRLGEPCLPRLLDRLGEEEETVRLNVQLALRALCVAWGNEDDRTETLLAGVKDVAASSNAGTKINCLNVFAAALESQPADQSLPAVVAKCTAELLESCRGEPACLLGTLQVTRAYLARVPPGQGVSLGRDLALNGLSQKDNAVRVAAVQLLLQPSLKKDTELLTKVVPFLKDANVEVRKAALLALAGERDLVDDDDLLALLHDPDAEVQILCELALSSRGLNENHILLGRLISDPRPSARLLVLDHLHRAPDLEPGVWLQRLSSDPIPAVRAAAVRAGATQKPAEFHDRLHEMARQDPSVTVRQLANFYLNRNASRFDEE